MNWKDTVMNEDELIAAYEIDNPADDHATGCTNMARKQAKLTWPIAEKAGIKKESEAIIRCIKDAKRGYSWESNPFVWVISFKLR